MTYLSSELTKQQNQIRSNTESSEKAELIVIGNIIRNIKVLPKKDIGNIKKKSTGNQDLKTTLNSKQIFCIKCYFMVERVIYNDVYKNNLICFPFYTSSFCTGGIV